jgi:hypothetical protein
MAAAYNSKQRPGNCVLTIIPAITATVSASDPVSVHSKP